MIGDKHEGKERLSELSKSRETLGIVGTPEAHAEEALPVLAIFGKKKPIHGERLCGVAV
jgi:hypothetical protein